MLLLKYTFNNNKSNTESINHSSIVSNSLRNLSRKGRAPQKHKLQGTCMPFLSPRFTAWPVTTAVQEFLALAWRKKLIVFAYHPSFPLGRCPTTSSSSRTATANLSRGFVVSALVAKLCPRCGVQRSLYS